MGNQHTASAGGHYFIAVKAKTARLPQCAGMFTHVVAAQRLSTVFNNGNMELL